MHNEARAGCRELLAVAAVSSATAGPCHCCCHVRLRFAIPWRAVGELRSATWVLAPVNDVKRARRVDEHLARRSSSRPPATKARRTSSIQGRHLMLALRWTQRCRIVRCTSGEWRPCPSARNSLSASDMVAIVAKATQDPVDQCLHLALRKYVLLFLLLVPTPDRVRLLASPSLLPANRCRMCAPSAMALAGCHRRRRQRNVYTGAMETLECRRQRAWSRGLYNVLEQTALVRWLWVAG